jgi:hypothetical protein
MSDFLQRPPYFIKAKLKAGPPGGNIRKKRCQISAGKIIIFSGSSRPMKQGLAKPLFNIDALVKSGRS